MMEVGDTNILGVPGDVDHLADLQQAWVVQRHGQVGLHEARGQVVSFSGCTFELGDSFTIGEYSKVLLVCKSTVLWKVPPEKKIGVF